MSRSGQSDQRSCAASNASSGVSVAAVSRDVCAARSWPAIISRSAAGEPKNGDEHGAVTCLRYHTGVGA